MDSDVDAKKQFLRDSMSRIITDFDYSIGAFSALCYNSPLVVATDEWARRAGHSADDLRRMITQMRIDSVCKTRSGPTILKIFEDWRSAIENRKIEINYQDPPLDLSCQDGVFKNRRDMKRHLLSRLRESELPITGEVKSENDEMTVAYDVHDKFGHRIVIRMTIKMRYGGTIIGYLKFPYFELHDPTELELFDLNGWRLFRKLGMPFPKQLAWTASKSKADFSQIDTVLDILRASASYLRA